MKFCFEKVALLLCCICVLPAHAQFDVEAYKKFLNENEHLTATQLLERHDVGLFHGRVNAEIDHSQYFSDADAVFTFTPYEKELLRRNSFMATERKKFSSFRSGFREVYVRDLPVYISADALLYAMHRSYDNMLKTVEEENLYPLLQNAMTEMRTKLADKTTNASLSPLEKMAARDADVYLTIALTLADEYGREIPPLIQENTTTVSELLALIKGLQPADYPLFSSDPRTIDFSQMKPRGHYTETKPLLAYFRAMMWLGRTEIYITSPAAVNSTSPENITRQCALAVMMAGLAKESGAVTSLTKIDKALSDFVGAEDNLTTEKLLGIIASQKLTIPQLADKATLTAFQTACIEAGANQRILSQILFGGGDTNKIQPAAAYMLMGQRFIIDSYVFANLVHDKVSERFMPSTLDAMFALGNDAAAQLLKKELETYESAKYVRNLEALRYLIDSYNESSWNSSLYGAWLGAIRTLSPEAKEKREKLPEFMQTAAWAQKSLNTQLASWAELRHDNILYAKQSYTGGLSCFYPGGFVEPVPAFYAAVRNFARLMSASVNKNFPEAFSTMKITKTMDVYEKVFTLLESMAIKELEAIEFSAEEKDLIKNWIVYHYDPIDNYGGGRSYYTGWYQDLLYDVSSGVSEDYALQQFTVADVHTDPNTGRVLHVATAPPTLAVLVAKDRDGCMTTYCGPTSSYYEFESDNFQRLTDQEWRDMNAAVGLRPDLVNIYLANTTGEIKGEVRSLATGVDDPPTPTTQAPQVYPNPFSTATFIGFDIPPTLSGKRVRVEIFALDGRAISLLLDRSLDAGNYTVRWDGTATGGERVTYGAYSYRLSVDTFVKSGTIILAEPVRYHK